MPRLSKNAELKEWVNKMRLFVFRTKFDKYDFLILVEAENLDAAQEKVKKQNQYLTGHETTCEGQLSQFII